MSITPPTRIELSDAALAKLVAHAAVITPGVNHLAPALPRVVKVAVGGIARRLTAASTEQTPNHADPAAVTVNATEIGITDVTVRLVATGNPPVLDTINAVQHNGQIEVKQLTERQINLTVMVVDTDSS